MGMSVDGSGTPVGAVEGVGNSSQTLIGAAERGEVNTKGFVERSS